MNSQQPGAIHGRSPTSDSAKDASRNEPEHTGMIPQEKTNKGMDTSAGVGGAEGHSIISSAGAIGKQFNPEGSVGSIGQKMGGPFSKHGAVGSQFDAGQSGIAGAVENLVSGPKSDSK